MTDGQTQTVYEQWQCTVGGRVGEVGRCCGRDTRRPLNDAAREGPPLAYQATGGADHQSTPDGWQYRPVNKAAMAFQMWTLAKRLQDAANALAALGMGRGRYPEWSGDMASLARCMFKWADEIAAEAVEGKTNERTMD